MVKILLASIAKYKVRKKPEIVLAPLVVLCLPGHRPMRYPISVAAKMKTLLLVGNPDCYVVGCNPPTNTEKNVFQFRGNELLLATLVSLSEKI